MAGCWQQRSSADEEAGLAPWSDLCQQSGDACTAGVTHEGVNLPVRALDELGTWEAWASPWRSRRKRRWGF